MIQQALKKSSTCTVNYEFKKVTGRVVNFRQLGSKPAGVGYQTILLRDAAGAEHLLQNVSLSHTLDPFLHASKGEITIYYVQGHGDGKTDKPFAIVAAFVTADGKSHSDIASVYTFSRGIRAQVRLPYAELLRVSILACIILLGIPFVAYALWRLFTVQVPLLPEELTRQEIKKLGLQGI